MYKLAIEQSNYISRTAKRFPKTQKQLPEKILSDQIVNGVHSTVESMTNKQSLKKTCYFMFQEFYKLYTKIRKWEWKLQFEGT